VLDVESLKREQDQIWEEIGTLGAKLARTETEMPIYDGVSDAEEYIASKYRICWVLKEAYGEGDDTCTLIDYILGPEGIGSIQPTWRIVIYVTYALLHDFKPYRERNFINKDPQMAQCLNNIAIINVGKMPAAPTPTTSPDADIAAKYEFWKPILHRQLKSYDPKSSYLGTHFSISSKTPELAKKN